MKHKSVIITCTTLLIIGIGLVSHLGNIRSERIQLIKDASHLSAAYRQWKATQFDEKSALELLESGKHRGMFLITKTNEHGLKAVAGFGITNSRLGTAHLVVDVDGAVFRVSEGSVQRIK